MAHIELNNDLPGIRGLMAYRPETEKPLNFLAETLLRDDNNTLSRGQRELIGTYVSYLNDCFYCQHSHGAIVTCYLNDHNELVDAVIKDLDHAPISDKMRALLRIAGSAQKGGKYVTTEQVEAAKTYGATDKDIHDTVLITAAFCMFNRYVDGLASNTPIDLSSYPLRAKQIAENGYGNHIFTNKQPVADKQEI